MNQHTLYAGNFPWEQKIFSISLHPVGLLAERAQVRHHPLAHVLKRHDLVRGAQGNRLARHAKDHSAGLVLGQGVGARLAHPQQAVSAVAAHAGQDHADGILSGMSGRRIE